MGEGISLCDDKIIFAPTLAKELIIFLDTVLRE